MSRCSGEDSADLGNAAKKPESLKKFIAERRKNVKVCDDSKALVYDPYEKSVQAKDLNRRETVLYYNEDVMLEHFCTWDEDHPENPSRVSEPLALCHKMGLFDRCATIKASEPAGIAEVTLIHSPEMYATLRNISNLTEKQSEALASHYDSVYFNKGTFQAALVALKASISMVEQIASNKYQNGFAFVRPPGHHAMRTDYCGYCFFNNVACAVKNVLDKGLAKRVMILDYDVHHGQGTQQAFFDNNQVLYLSIHRYEHGTFWPNLQESNFDHIGIGKGKGFNVNVPLNETGLTDSDYLAIVHHIVLPIAYEFNPDLIVISAGYDASIGCPEGMMRVSPGFYGHLMTQLYGLANGRIAAVLEGGYYGPSLCEGIALTIRGLLGDPCAPLEQIVPARASVIDSINNVKTVLLPYWNCFKICSVSDIVEPNYFTYHHYSIKYYGEPPTKPYQTRGAYPYIRVDRIDQMKHLVQSYVPTYINLKPKKVIWCYDEEMLKHKGNGNVPEKPERLTAIREKFEEFGLTGRMDLIQNKRDDIPIWMAVMHEPEYVSKLVNGKIMPKKDLFVNEFTPRAINVAVTGLLSVVDLVMMNKVAAGVAIIRPPGHHAEKTTPGGFCFINNVAVAAKYIESIYHRERILIVDFDVHHGNGTQELFYDSKNILFISVHRYDGGRFYPSTFKGGVKHKGQGIGEGYNVNIPFDSDKMGNGEYLAVFHNLILPIAYSFAPEVVLVSAGFDAGINDPLGCYKVTPEMFGHFIQLLKPLATGKLVLALEGGYNVTTTAYAATICTKALLGDPIPVAENLYKKLSSSCKKTIQKVLDVHKIYWPVLNVHKILPAFPVAHDEAHEDS